ncbi:MAG: serpin family protein [Fimbriimonadaceae bacterium]
MKRAYPFLALLAVSCGGNNTGSPTPGLYSDNARNSREREEMVANASKTITKGEAAKVVLASNEFGAKLLNEIGTDKNVLISPISIATALTIAMNGASGTTLDEMKKGLGLERISMDQINIAHASLRTLLGDETGQLKIANSIWSRKGVIFEDSFMKDNTAFFNAQIADLDFAAPESSGIINDWVKTATDGKIAEIVSKPIPGDVDIYLINAVSFDAKWKDSFDPQLTRKGPFALADGKQIETDFMSRDDEIANGESKEGDEWVRLPYANDRFELIAVLPGSGRTTKQAISKVDEYSKAGPRAGRVLIKLPKFKANYTSELVPYLQKLGVKQAFSGNANFARLAKGVFISKVAHKTFIDVFEEGTSAAAATALSNGRSNNNSLREITFNRAFAYAIRETKSGQIIFLGVLADPTAN